jgi:hypothetical protein
LCPVGGLNPKQRSEDEEIDQRVFFHRVMKGCSNTDAYYVEFNETGAEAPVLPEVRDQMTLTSFYYPPVVADAQDHHQNHEDPPPIT